MKKTADILSEYSGKRLAVGVSGGRDSMCLLHAVIHCGVVEKKNIVAVHVNHCLRKTADRDEAFVRAFCRENNVRFVFERVDVDGECARRGLTVEQAARDLRYGVFNGLLDIGVADVVLTAHHALDNAETVLMHMFRGAGLAGLRGMAVFDAGRRIVRPFIGVYPDELDEYCAACGIDYMTDETNLSDDADRNFIRLNVMPMIEKRYGGAARAVNGFADECSKMYDVLDDMLDMSLIAHDRGAVVIKGDALSGKLGTLYVRRALSEFTLTDITREQTERVAALAHMRTGATVQLSNGIAASHEYGGVALYIPRLRCDAEVPIAVGANFIDGLAVDILTSDREPSAANVGLCVDLDKIDGAVLRFRRDGDVFAPFGGGQKKLKQYFIDIKLPKRLRDRIPLVCIGNEVLVVAGMQVSDKAKQTAATLRKGVVVPRW